MKTVLKTVLNISKTLSGCRYYGSIRSGGGAFSDKEKAVEDQYFHNKERDDLAKLKREEAKITALRIQKEEEIRNKEKQ